MKMILDRNAVAELRKEFPSLNPAGGEQAPIFLDGPGGTQVHGSVIDAMGRYLVHSNANLNAPFAHSRRTGETLWAGRCAIADLVNAHSPEEIVFGPNMTSLTYTLSRAIGRTLSPGDEIVVTRLDHDANIAPWMALEERGAIVRHVDFRPEDCTLDMDGLEAAISSRTKLVAVGYASNAVGTINDIPRVIDLAHAVGAWVFVDAVHFAPHGLIDVQELGCDFLVSSIYKYFGPHQGALYGRGEILAALPAYKVRPAKDAHPHKFETGTLSFEAIAGSTAAVDYLASVGRRFGGEEHPEDAASLGRRQYLVKAMNSIREYETGLGRQLIAGLSALSSLRIYGITEPSRFDERVPTVSFTMEGATPREIGARLGAAGVHAWSGNFYALAVTRRLGLEDRGGLLRVGLAHYNTPEEVDTLLGILEDMP
jgi:cysteine desulfurase family protein (TIGR01976 family)